MKKKQKSCVHLYYGDGKGKTTAAIGLAIRAAGAGKKVVFYQFLKSNDSSERKILEQIQEITCLKGAQSVKFTRNMSAEEKKENRKENTKRLLEVLEKSKDADMLILDEALYAINLKQLEEKPLLVYLKNRPETQEVILTGRNPSEQMKELADYCSNIKKEKHPFDQEISARLGIEY